MWVNKSVNPSQTSTRAAQATPPRMKPGTVYAAGRVTHTALRADLRRNGSEWQSLPPRARRGKRCSASAQGELWLKEKQQEAVTPGKAGG